MSKAAADPASIPSVRTETRSGGLPLLVFAWIATLAVSSLPNILITEYRLTLPVSLLTAKLLLLGLFLSVTFVWTQARPLRLYLFLFTLLQLFDAAGTWIGTQPFWRELFPAGGGFTNELLSSQLLRLGTAFAMVVALWIVYRNRQHFFLAAGALSAPATPVRWLGMDRPVPWARLGWISALCITGGTLAFLVLAGQPDSDFFARLLPLLPAVLLFSAMNGFSEELSYRAALLAPLRNAVGPRQALLLTAALFGLWHFYGVPYGILGVALAGVLGWYLGKSMLETRGLFWPWFIHFWQDVAIFAFIAAGSVTPGG